ncbi:MAG: DUF3592 domain-containing protein [Bacteroidales bacterium]|nr:DUF3592 domain-containing protein [Bacteroidales bacterium]
MPKEISFEISRLQFWVVTVLILLLPLSSKYKLIVMGEKTTGRVIGHQKVSSGRLSEHDTYSVIQFQAGTATVRMYGPENTIYELGDTVTVYYSNENPRNCMIPSLPFIYTGRSAIIPFIMLLVWVAFYNAFKYIKSANTKI